MGRNLLLTLLERLLTTANCTEIHWSSNNGSTWTKSAMYLIKKGPKSTLLPKWVDPLSENGFRRSFCSIFRVGWPITSSKLIHEGNPLEIDCPKRLKCHSFDPLKKVGLGSRFSHSEEVGRSLLDYCWTNSLSLLDERPQIHVRISSSFAVRIESLCWTN